MLHLGSGLFAGHLIGIQQQAGSLIAVSAMGGAVTGALFAGVAGIGTLCPSAAGGNQAGHVLNHIVLVLLLAGDFVEVFNTLEDDAVIVAPVKEIGLAALSLLVVPSEVGSVILDHCRGIIAGAVYGNVVDVSLGLSQRSSQSFIGSCRKCAHGQQAEYHDQTQHQANYTFHSFHNYTSLNFFKLIDDRVFWLKKGIVHLIIILYTTLHLLFRKMSMQIIKEKDAPRGVF